jgi:hypothetical protein
MTINEPSEMDWMIMERQQHGLPGIGPLTKDQQESMDSYERWQEEQAAEYEAQEAAGGRTICPECSQRKMVWKTVCTYGYWGHPGADYSAYGCCENCGHEEL